MTSNSWFEINKEGLAKLLQGRSKGFILYELLQNAWDQQITQVDVIFEPVEGKHGIKLVVKDDDPDGFQDLSHAFTLFAESNKKGDPTKRGRFNLGEKLVLACCESAEIITTTGGVEFTKEGGRRSLRRKTEGGSIFSAYIKMSRAEYQEVCDSIDLLIPPPYVITTFNGKVLPGKEPIRSFETILPTEVCDENGNLKKTARKTLVNLYAIEEGKTAYIYEMGIPVVETDGCYHIDIQQKVPLNMERDNVTPAYLRKLRTEVLNHTFDLINENNVNDTWVKDAFSDEHCENAAVTAVLDNRFGKNRVAFDPSDPEANKTAVSDGYIVIHPRQLSKEEWKNTKRTGTTLPAGQVFPTKHATSGPGGVPPIADKDLTVKQKEVISFCKLLAIKLLGFEISVEIFKINDSYRACYGSRSLTLNLYHLGNKFFNTFPQNMVAVLDLLIHELGHEYCKDHLSRDYYDALTNLGAKLTLLALREPELFPNRKEGNND